MRQYRLLTGPLPVGVVVVAVGVAAAVRGNLTDLYVYRFGGQAVLDGLSLAGSTDPVTGLHFTYPPFAALVALPLAPLPFWLAAALWTAASTAALAGVVGLVRRAYHRSAPGWLVALLTTGALALEPVWQNLTFGQVNLILMLAVVVDLLRPERHWSGVLIGIAAGVKLTPLVFVVLLVLVGRRTAAGRAVAAFAATVALGFVVLPGSSATYWAHNLIHASRIGPPSLAHNQSVYGALTRLLDGPPPTLVWLAIAGPLAVAVLVLGAIWWRRGDRALGTCLGAMAMLFASPISWSHHWVWAVPVAVALWERSRWASAAWTAVFVTRPFVWLPWGEQREYAWTPVEHVVGNTYLLAALALCGWAAVALARSVHDPDRTSLATSAFTRRLEGLALTTKSDFTEDEWARIVRAPFVAGMAISLADPGGPIEATKETMATLRSATNPPSREQLLSDVALDISAMAQQKKSPLGGYRPTKDGVSWGEQVLEELRGVQALVAAKAEPDESAAFGRWLVAAAQAAAEAAKEGGFMGIGAQLVSEREEAMLDQVRAAVSV